MKTPSPKDVFLSDSSRVKQHQAVVDTPLVISGLHTAFAQMCWALGQGDVQTSLHANSMREGARRFITEFLTLGDASAPPVKLSSELEPEPKMEFKD